MDPNLKPEPEHMQQAGWLWALMGAALLWLGTKLEQAAGYFLKKHDSDDTRKDILLAQYDEALKRHVEISAGQFTEMRERITRIESQPMLTEQRLREIVKEAVDGVTKIFQPEHQHLVGDLNGVRTEVAEVKKEVKECAAAINKRVNKLADRLPPLANARRISDDDEEGKT